MMKHIFHVVLVLGAVALAKMPMQFVVDAMHGGGRAIDYAATTVHKAADYMTAAEAKDRSAGAKRMRRPLLRSWCLQYKRKTDALNSAIAQSTAASNAAAQAVSAARQPVIVLNGQQYVPYSEHYRYSYGR